MKTFIATLAALAVAGGVAWAQQKAPQQKASAEAKTFANKVAAANTFEIQSSKIAEQRGQSADVKSFAKKMIQDHTKAGQDFKSALSAANMSPPPEKLALKQKWTMAKLRKAQGPAFDKSYVSAQLKAHKEAVSLFRNYSKSGRTAPLKDFAQKTLPTLEKHLSMVQNLSSQGIASKKGGKGAGSRAIGPPADKSTPGGMKH